MRLELSPTAWVTLEKVAQQGIWFALFCILAPILGPRPYGLLALVMVVVGFCEIVIVDAIAEAVLCVEDPAPAHLAAANFAGAVAAIVVGLGIAATAGWIAAGFGEPALVPLFEALAPLPALSALNAVPIATLQREMQFRALALRSIAGILAGGAAAVGLAVSGAGVWALVAQVLCQRLVEMAVLWRYARQPLAFAWSPAHLRDLGRYARSVLVSRGMTWLSGQAPRIIVGRVLGAADLGMLTLGARLLDLVIQVAIRPRTTVARVEFMRFRSDAAGLEPAFLDLLRRLELVVLPICLGGAAVVPALFGLWLDARWQPGVPAAQFYLASGAAFVMFYGCANLMLALGRPDLEAILSTVHSALSVLVAVAVAPYGLVAVSLALAGLPVLLLPLPFLLVRRAAAVRPLWLIARLLPLASAALAMGVATLLLGDRLLPAIGTASTLAVQLTVGVVVYPILAWASAPRLVRAWTAEFTQSPGLRRLFGAVRSIGP